MSPRFTVTVWGWWHSTLHHSQTSGEWVEQKKNCRIFTEKCIYMFESRKKNTRARTHTDTWFWPWNTWCAPWNAALSANRSNVIPIDGFFSLLLILSSSHGTTSKLRQHCHMCVCVCAVWVWSCRKISFTPLFVERIRNNLKETCDERCSNANETDQCNNWLSSKFFHLEFFLIVTRVFAFWSVIW